MRASRTPGVRYRDAVFMPDGDSVLALSDESGELEFVELSVTGVGPQKYLTGDGEILRFQGHPSPDGRWIAYTDQNRDLWLLELASREQRVISSSREGARHIAWSPDSRRIAFAQDAGNSFSQIQLYSLADGSLTAVTSNRVNSWSPAWDPAGDWLQHIALHGAHQQAFHGQIRFCTG